MLKQVQVANVAQLAEYIRKIPHWPQENVLFHDITPLLQNPLFFRMLIDALVYRYIHQPIDVIAGLDARGFIIGSALAYQLNVGFVPIRKQGKLPFDTVCAQYALEYGKAVVEIHTDAIEPNAKVLLVDDLIATGGTMQAGIQLIHRLQGEIVEVASVLELTDLSGGADIRAQDIAVFSLFQSRGDIESPI